MNNQPDTKSKNTFYLICKVLSLAGFLLFVNPLQAQIQDEFTPRTGQLTSVGKTGFPFAAQSFYSNVNVVRHIGIWLAESSPQGQVTISIAPDLNGYPNLNNILYESSLMDPGPLGQWFIDSSLTLSVIQGQKYWILADGYNNAGSSGAAHVGTSSSFTDTGEDLIYALNALPTWDTLQGSRLAIRVNGDTCSFAGNIFVNSIASFCQGDSAQLVANPGFAQYLWSMGDTTSSIWVSSAGTFVLTVFDSLGCAAIDTGYAFSYGAPNFSLGPDLEDCPSTQFDLTAPLGAYTYLWSTGDTVFTIRVDQEGTYYLEVTNVFGCTGIDSVEVTLLPTPSPDLGGDSLICQGKVRVIDAGAGYSSYFWSDGQTTRSVVVTTTGSVSVVVLDSNGCLGSSNTVKTTVVPRPGQPTISKNGDLLTASQAFAYQWLLETSPISNATAQTWFPLATGNYAVQITDTNGCTNQSTELYVVTEVGMDDIPGGFSPNGDGINDYFEVVGLEFFPGNEFRVFNRWGNVVYETTDFQGAWNGMGNSGKPLPDATYIYILDLKNGAPPFQGTVVINR
ncbi:MAG: gliding motility-associated C-terminal domain-containing protein [Bacteroidia bacterium]|nr:gliding motility-associated C-terminal domain-containing protein [Bacteroidia bacterium]